MKSIIFCEIRKRVTRVKWELFKLSSLHRENDQLSLEPSPSANQFINEQ